MRQTHAAGERLFVDYAGDGVPVVIDRLTGEMRKAQIFVAVLGASSFTFAHAGWTQALPDWIDAHVHALAAIGGVPQLLVPDNTKTAVIKACHYDPQVNRTYAEMAAHYGAAILPARPRKPRDKAKVEQAVLIVERWLLGRLRHRTFYSLAEVNAAIADLMTHLNEERPIRRLGVTRRQLLEEVDRPTLKSLPDEPYEFSEWRTCRVGIDYHVEAAAHFYSVPHHRGGRSVTELEILHGVLNNPTMAGRAFFYFRSPAYAAQKGGDYVAASSEDSARQADLKDRIRRSGFPVVEDYPSPQAFAERLESDLWRVLDAAYPADDVPDAFERENRRHDAYALPRRRLYFGGERYIAGLSALAESGAQRILIEGQSGGGKSALIANWIEAYQAAHPDVIVHSHYTGASADAADPTALVRRLSDALNDC